MGITLTNISFKNEFTNETSPILRGAIGDLITVTHDFTIGWNTKDTTLNFSEEDKTIIRGDCGLANGSFLNDGFQEGDTILITGTASNNGMYTIHAISFSTIVVNETLTNEVVSGNIYGVTNMAEYEFLYNFRKSNQDVTYDFYEADGLEQSFRTTFAEMQNDYYYYYSYYGGVAAYMNPTNGSYAWFIDSASGNDCRPFIEYNGIDSDYVQSFSVTFKTIITPIYENGQLYALQQAMAQNKGDTSAAYRPPDYFIQGSTLQYIFQININRNVGDVNPAFSSDIFQFSQTNNPNNIKVSPKPLPQRVINSIGQILWFNQYYNGGVLQGTTLYKTNPLQYAMGSYTVGVDTVDQLDVFNTTGFEFYVENLSGINFANKKAVLNFCWLPQNPQVFEGYSEVNQNLFRQILMLDRVSGTIDNAANSGDKYGTDYQVFNNDVKFNYVGFGGKNYVKVYGSVTFSDYLINLFSNIGTDVNYMIWVNIENSTDSVTTQIHSPILLDVNSILVNVSDPTVFQITTGGGRIQWFKTANLSGSGENGVEIAVGDYAAAYAGFKVAKGSLIQNMNFEIVNTIYNYSGDVVETNTLSKKEFNLIPYSNGTFTDATINQSMGFSLASDDKRNIVSIERDSANDDANFYAYKINYGFYNSPNWWQFAEQQSEISTAPFNYFPAYNNGKIGTSTTLPAGYTTDLVLKVSTNINTPFDPTKTEKNPNGNITPFEITTPIYGRDGNNNPGVSTLTSVNSFMRDLLMRPINNQPLLNEIFFLITEFNYSGAVLTNQPYNINVTYIMDGNQHIDTYSSLNGASPNSLFKTVFIYNTTSPNNRITIFAACDFSLTGIVFTTVTNFNFRMSFLSIPIV